MTTLTAPHQTAVVPPPPEEARQPRWVVPALVALLIGTAGLYLWGLSANGWGNAFYAAAAQAGGASWKAWFFGSFDASNLITVDKPPASLWAMGLSVRIFGLSSWSLLVPQALMGVATVGVLFATVRRWAGPAAGLVAGTVLALTPVAALMFRFDNPDAMLVLLLTLAAYALVRSIETASTRWLMLVGALIGFAFLTKMLQAFLVLPAFALAYLLVADTPVRRRLLQLVAAGLAMVAAAGWWIAIVELWPAGSRPYIGGSQTNSILELALGYNGLGRITGDETGSVTGGGGGTSMWGDTGITRLFSSSYGGQASWLIPGALILMVAVLCLTARAPRTDRTRASMIIWGGWLLTTGLTFSFMAGIIHEYYTVALAPAIGALVGVGAVELWQRRSSPMARLGLAVAVVATVAWAWVLLGRSADFVPWLRYVVVAIGLVGALVILAWHRLPRAVAVGVAMVTLAATLAGPAAYAVDTVSTAHTGSIVTAGPTVSGGRGGPGGGGPGGGRGAFTGTPPAQGTPPQGGRGGFGGGGGGGLLGATTPSDELVALLETDASSYSWVAAAIGSNTAAGYQLATEDPVMAIGGFNGSDPAPTLAQFQEYVADGQVHYFIGGGVSGQSNGGSEAAQEISSWVEQSFTATTIDGVTVYDLSGGATS